MINLSYFIDNIFNCSFIHGYAITSTCLMRSVIIKNIS